MQAMSQDTNFSLPSPQRLLIAQVQPQSFANLLACRHQQYVYRGEIFGGKQQSLELAILRPA